jgi:hypothetical protein
MEKNFSRASLSAQLNFSVRAKTAKYKNNQPDKGAIKFHACKCAGVKYNAATKSHEKFGSSYQIKLIVSDFCMQTKDILGEVRV